MQFYDISYITQHQSMASTIRSVIIIILLVILTASSAYYLRNRLRTRWRDISIGMVLLTFVLLGIQMQDYLQNRQDFSQSQTLVKLIESIATDNHVKKENVYVNATSLSSGIIVRFNEKNYRINLNADNNSYSLERTHVIDHTVTIVKGD
ncbi:DUF3290 domain-containing protein [Streptococcus sp. DD12]|uniref:DUF3290 domain-containing protein n=1 Tax=Streptococcus sp. DD12 TaxID=1777880 RepID=UPI000798C7CB|nr:DUF3290 domain-containing protein [Streptococcus sp. DD12]KXT76082.1 hypothetical protein STRDD12_01194 [Streptococcus sp. DD12]